MTVIVSKAQAALLKILPKGPFGLRGAQHQTVRSLARKGLARWWWRGKGWRRTGTYRITAKGKAALTLQKARSQ